MSDEFLILCFLVCAHRLITGETGSGKSNYLVGELLAVAEKRTEWIIAIFPHPAPARQFISELYARWGKSMFRRLIVERLADMDKVVMRRYILSSSAENYWDRVRENDLYCSFTLSMLARRRNLLDLAENPVLEKYTKLAVQLFQYQDQWASESWLPLALEPNHPMWGYFIKHCTNEEIRWETLQLEHRFRSQKDRLYMLDPGTRMLKGIFRSPPIMARTSAPATWDKAAFLNQGGIYVVMADDVSDDALRVHAGCDFAETVFMAKRGLIKEGVYAIDEALNYQLLGEFEAKAFATVRAFGLD